VYSDLTLEGILPIDQDFKCGIGIFQDFFIHYVLILHMIYVNCD